MTKPKRPTDLGEAGAALFDAVVRDYRLSPVELASLHVACRQADLVAALEAIVGLEDLMTVGSKGQPRLHPAVTALGPARTALARLIGGLKLPSTDDPEEPASSQPVAGESYATIRARRAANIRWRREKAKRGAAA